MNKIHFHIDEINWNYFSDNKYGPLRWKELLNRERGGSKEFIFGLAELPPGGRLTFHTHQQAETVYILSGSATVRQGARSVELVHASALYFLGNTPHSIETLGSEPLRYVYTYACEKLGDKIDLELQTMKDGNGVDIRNWNADTRWAIRDEIENWIWPEASKGYKVRVKLYFDYRRGNAHEMKAGIAEIDPGIHYTLHYHDQPEIYFIISGCGIIYVAGVPIEVSPGLALYIGGRTVHGADCLSEEPLRIYYVVGAETVGQNLNWTPVEDIYTNVRWRR